MVIKCLPIGLFASNCYIVGQNGEGVVIDPGCSPQMIVDAAKENNLEIKYIIITHGHIDHLMSVDEVRKKTGAEVLIHEKDADKLTDPNLNDPVGVGLGRKCKAADRLLKDGEVITVGGLDFEIIHTPGHSAGGICIKVGDVVFTGDTLFCMGIGRTDFPDGDLSTLLDSIKNKLMKLDDNVVVYPGHGEPTTIGRERKEFS
ncbi:MAG TPA: MBL fold metallo-hydrolase [Hungateiclostridium thermocellum]|jgi:hydroxyacylglutathione hydrolase|uniref:Beta-lactamase-like protein n=2 Tax=Acetivibrio thermocellus TaxID=1515 RepID=A3DF45_ACET2|nr:MBL fold metallo-hydrolase [Acetivibrio thermocellus]CDG36017.1 beta-lactamase-like protein [Acetivibrio thermocellus BC1]ABN52574.1 beta-lactamase-like protein [Acetivibrio thermocellus ATCC 27405]ADU73979.1 beta-lactamase-like protein [Acetivibrio thermocellus DSM 1313]ALX07917.1 beta-lactamase domain protein [Acetivibrio thermocellus AD2]ANV75663.1 beta-lactamase domain protein [Acetivibrio thermocellus DSM 2360]